KVYHEEKGKIKIIIKIVIVKIGSYTNVLAHYLKGHFEDQYFEVEIFDLAEHPIHQLVVSGVSSPSEVYKNNLTLLQTKARNADYFILETPKYHGSHSGI